MGKSQYKKCVDLLKECQRDEVTFDEIITLIKTKIGNDKYRTIKPCFELMELTKLIKEIADGKFKILCR